ncbi:hypothetical protein Kpho02_44640 [Kitasatospora phosalacinea]|uniref:Nucleotide pyrophosphohydrolase n=1 Tax=Kitasatospora phosalacinea TaxID=2065 RepID=A0A9W6Q8A8_9ACTN|nr:hypothetical protein Kpho02_44640 [Kitasatospora phosalacinea]
MSDEEEPAAVADRVDRAGRADRVDRAGRADRADRPGGGGLPEAGPTVPELQRRLAEFAAVRQWQQYHTPKNLASALTVEAGELLEVFQWLTPEQAADVMSDADSAHRVRDEVADVLAYLLQLCTVLEVDPLQALAEKIERNESRFPAP